MIQSISRVRDDLVELIFEPDEGDNNFPGALVRLASYVTMVGREWIMELLLKAGLDNIYYCDTDSLIFKGNTNLLNPI